MAINMFFTFRVAFIPRGGAINNLLFSSDNRLLVYDFDKVLVDVQSPFQHVQIFHSTQFGNTLVLDDFVSKSHWCITQSCYSLNNI